MAAADVINALEPRTRARVRYVLGLHGVPKQFDSLEFLRFRYDALVSEFAVADDATVEPVDIDGVPVNWVGIDGVVTDRVIIQLHGGGCMFGSADAYAGMGAELARNARARVAVVDYRLAPENRFPAASDDVRTVWNSIVASGTDPSKIAVFGDSAGGSLALGLAISLRDEGLPGPACVVSVSAITDRTCASESFDTNLESDGFSTREGVLANNIAYLGEGVDVRLPLASPYWADMAGLPPLLLMASGSEVLRDDTVRLAEKAREAGVETELEVVPDMLHAWPIFGHFLPEAQEALQRSGEFVRKHTGG